MAGACEVERYDELRRAVSGRPLPLALLDLGALERNAQAMLARAGPLPIRLCLWLSPFYQRDSVAISVHQYVGMEYERYFRAAEAIFRRYGGRPHWGKMHTLGARELAPLYPRWDDFQRLRSTLDPCGLFMNRLLERLFVA